jgi:hypothetical protein
MNIDHCDELCCTGAGPSTATLAGVQRVRKALDLLERPPVVGYVDIVDAHTAKLPSGEPCHTEGLQKYLELGCDVSCRCVLTTIMRQLGYALVVDSGDYARIAQSC